jgi:ubiquinone/menaquinone biosynthesis C-methylase UbiE
MMAKKDNNPGSSPIGEISNAMDMDQNEQHAATAFNRQSALFDKIYSPNPIIQYKRERVRNHVLALLAPGSSILELNSGTGDDAIFFAKEGFRVHATDLSPGMQQVLSNKTKGLGLEPRISQELCSFSELSKLKWKGPFDMIFSNFGGLNCTGRLDQVLAQFDPLLKPGGLVTLVIMPGFCLWETALVFKGRFKGAFRRFFSSQGRMAKIEGESFRCWYYPARHLKKILRKSYEWIGTEGLCTWVPPSYLENFPQAHPGLFSFLKKKEDQLKNRWPWKFIGDYYIISFRKNGDLS